MAIISSTYGLHPEMIHYEDCDARLEEIMEQVGHYLYNFGHSWFFLSIGRSYFQRCCKSWVRVSSNLEKFLRDPRMNYSLLMIVLEHEIQKFPAGSYYGKQLRELEKLVALGPSFRLFAKYN